MVACEKCWREAGGDAERYEKIIKGKDAVTCNPREQAGPDGTDCPRCGGAGCVHQHAKVCMACFYDVGTGTALNRPAQSELATLRTRLDEVTKAALAIREAFNADHEAHNSGPEEDCRACLAIRALDETLARTARGG